MNSGKYVQRDGCEKSEELSESGGHGYAREAMNPSIVDPTNQAQVKIKEKRR